MGREPKWLARVGVGDWGWGTRARGLGDWGEIIGGRGCWWELGAVAWAWEIGNKGFGLRGWG